MKLIWFRVRGFRRFKDESTLDVVGKLVGLVGQNEAGKTSLLKALRHVGDETAFGELDLTREHELPAETPVVEAAFFLEEHDRSFLGQFFHGESVRWFHVLKYQDGHREFKLRPTIRRDRSMRRQCAAELRKSARSPALEHVEGLDASELTALAEELEADTENLKASILRRVESVASAMAKASETLPQYMQKISESLTELHANEVGSHPEQSALDILKQRLPRLLFFDEEARTLRSKYNLANISEDPLLALDNLARVAGLELSRVVVAAEAKDRAQVRSLTARANDRLADAFEAWNQSAVKVRFDVEGTILHIQIEDEGRRFSTLGERSDGLRQFVALMAFAQMGHAREVNRPILLIDEAEAHLHYDAQADLVQMFATQEVAQKVIYTTHSAGCLPEDLGTGVRLVTPIGDGPHSEVNNWFWTDESRGFAPLLFGMGARTLAFFPTRRALVVEGISDLILLPSLLREASEEERIGFQIVPGLSSINKREVSLLELAGRSVCYLTDQDEGGRELRENLVSSGIPEDRIFAISPADLRAKTVEDFVDPEVFHMALQRQLEKWYDLGPPVGRAEIPASGRAKFLSDWTKGKGITNFSKRALAYEVIDCLGEDPDRGILDQRRTTVLKRLRKSILEGFE